MVSQRDLADARAIMLDFAERTGLWPVAKVPTRYLWTDAFAVCTYLALFAETRNQEFLQLATRLIDQVHETLGKHRSDDERHGWISGLDEEAGRQHPTAGGLRIGKALNERTAGQPYAERQEWDRDGQYFHYLTKWMHALERAAVVTSNPTFCRWAIELTQSAHAAFCFKPSAGGTLRMVWKMSIDLSRPLVPSMGQHDPLDAFVTYGELDDCHKVHFADCEMPDLELEIRDAAAMCTGQSWASEDPLGIGGLLTDACRIQQLPAFASASRAAMLEQMLADARAGLTSFVRHLPLLTPATHRLAFRELGLSIGLHAASAVYERVSAESDASSALLSQELTRLMRFSPLAGQIEAFWRDPENQTAATWREHLDINSVMLATSLLPEQFLLV